MLDRIIAEIVTPLVGALNNIADAIRIQKSYKVVLPDGKTPVPAPEAVAAVFDHDAAQEPVKPTAAPKPRGRKAAAAAPPPEPEATPEPEQEPVADAEDLRNQLRETIMLGIKNDQKLRAKSPAQADRIMRQNEIRAALLELCPESEGKQSKLPDEFLAQAVELVKEIVAKDA